MDFNPQAFFNAEEAGQCSDNELDHTSCESDENDEIEIDSEVEIMVAERLEQEIQSSSLTRSDTFSLTNEYTPSPVVNTASPLVLSNETPKKKTRGRPRKPQIANVSSIPTPTINIPCKSSYLNFKNYYYKIKINLKKVRRMYGKDGTPWLVDSETSSTGTQSFCCEFTERTSNLHSMMEFFNYFINKDMMDDICKHTNERIAITEKHILIHELNGFFGLLLLFGVTKKNDIDLSEIWDHTSINHMDWATACMSRDRFKFICWNISFDDFSSRSERSSINSKFYKMNKIFDIFRNNCMNGLVLGAHMCIDEQLYSYRGRCSFKQYIPSKPAKYGIKYWSLVDCKSGYLSNVFVYLGKS